MHYDLSKIEEHPARVFSAFAAVEADTGLTQNLIYLIADSTDLAVASGAADNEVVSKGSQLSDIQHQDISGLFIEGSLHSLLSYLPRFQN